jgi:hypothetical protein
MSVECNSYRGIIVTFQVLQFPALTVIFPPVESIANQEIAFVMKKDLKKRRAKKRLWIHACQRSKYASRQEAQR